MITPFTFDAGRGAFYARIKPALCLVLVLFFRLQAQAQSEDRDKPLRFGLFFALEQHSMGASVNNSWKAGEPVMYFDPKTPGFGLGGFMRWNLFSRLAIQPELAFSYAANRATLLPGNESNIKQQYRFANLELPLHFILTSPPSEASVRGIVLFGGRMGFNFSDNFFPENVSLLHELFSLDLGLGAEIRLKKIKIQPEVLYSHGMNNLHDFGGSPYDWSIGRIVRDRLALRVLFCKN